MPDAYLPPEFVEFVRAALVGSVRPMGAVYYLAPDTAGEKVVMDFMAKRRWVPQRDYLMLMDVTHVDGLGGSYVHAGTGLHMKRHFGRFLVIRDPAHARDFAQVFAGLKPITVNEIEEAKNGTLRIAGPRQIPLRA